jgi:hypothetical protein
VHKQLSKSEVQTLSLPAKLDSNDQFKRDIMVAYDNYMQKKAALICRHVKFYKRITYTLLDTDGNFNSHLDLHVNTVVHIQEEGGISYAKIKAIFTHKYNDGLIYAFIWIDWLQKTSIMDPIIQCQVYEVQAVDNMQWYRVYPITFINSIPKVHFVHRCHSTCTSDLHDLTNNQYFKNEFYYTAI